MTVVGAVRVAVFRGVCFLRARCGAQAPDSAIVASGAEVVGSTLEMIWTGVGGQPEVLSAVVSIVDRVVRAWCVHRHEGWCPPCEVNRRAQWS